MPKVNVNGININYEEAGSGPPLLLISGLGQSRFAWATVAPVLAEHHRVITFDNRGTGQSDVPEGPYTMQQLGDDAAALIDELGIGPVPAVGWSMGGVILQSMLIHNPGKVSKAVLLATFPNYTSIQQHWLDSLLILREAGASDDVLATATLPWGFTPHTLLNHDRLQALLDMMKLDPEPTSNEGYAAQAHGIRRFDWRPDLHKVDTPTLVIVGAEDVLTPPSQAFDMADRIPGAKLIIQARGGHGLPIEFPQPTITDILEFFGEDAEEAPAVPQTESAVTG